MLVLSFPTRCLDWAPHISGCLHFSHRENSCLTLIIKLYLNRKLAKKLIECAAGLPAQPYFISSSSCYFSLHDRSVPSVVSLALRLDVKLKLVSRLTITIVEYRTKQNTLKTCHGAFTSKWVLPLSVRLILGSYIILSLKKICKPRTLVKTNGVLNRLKELSIRKYIQVKAWKAYLLEIVLHLFRLVKKHGLL